MKTQTMPPMMSKQAAKRVQGMSVVDKTRVRKGILGIPNGDIRPLEGTKDSFRLRIGNWRIIFHG